MAANVKFDLSLKNAVKTNTVGTVNIVALAKQMSLLESFIHISTSFCQCGESVLEEHAYQTNVSAEVVIHMINTMTDQALEAIKSQLLDELQSIDRMTPLPAPIINPVGPFILSTQPGTGSFQDATTEKQIHFNSMVASWKEPVPGWVDNMNGPTGLIIGAGKGVIRSMLCNANYLTDIIPCDMAVNAVIAAAWQVGTKKSIKPIFLNATANQENPISWGDALEIGKEHVLANPFSRPLWYPGGRLTSSKILHWFAVLWLHTIPAYLLDILLIITGNKPFMVRIQSRVNIGLELLQYYTMKQWIFRNDNLRDLHHRLCPSDRETFFMDTKLISWNEYLLAYILGTRQYYLKDDPSTLPRARRIFMYLYFADCLLKIAFGVLVSWIMYTWIISAKPIIATLVETND
ncbi:putative fatty acyl-CoA reductase CG5065 [Formica exsecta]|uniref:putative fatty acyl-CoA reductase CG5065 n=1 Tax=Formica exsecta TaxID=72781 RepID=UPI001143B789|nr:putative fatty acyl-CoA reductase CG5065 [Formica exsecta]